MLFEGTYFIQIPLSYITAATRCHPEMGDGATGVCRSLVALRCNGELKRGDARPTPRWSQEATRNTLTIDSTFEIIAAFVRVAALAAIKIGERWLLFR
jgi:hypothetical protein